ncbi:BTAD domain-containing putative transcriptional regulator [Plantactinospora sp. WMMB334]|uniref:BTAD domain-containing putative transcriptional regulator n=1 Tax=Plantactinospora sp. WMMB334 TaxID=3404119 RepID=UPI003B93EE7E
MVRLRVLGPIEADVRGQQIDLGGPKQRAALALLVIGRGEAVSIDRLIEQLWRGEPPPRAIASLQAFVSNLRRLLEPDRPRRAPATVLVTVPPGYALRLPEDAVDAWRFERAVRQAREAPPGQVRQLLDEALGCWRGDAYAEVADEAWAAAEITRLTDLRLAAQELTIGAALGTGRTLDAISLADAVTRAHPLREEGWRLLGLALWASGRQADALAALRRNRRILRDELGIVPGPPLVALEQAILTQRMEVLHEAAPPGAGPGQPDPLAGPGRREPDPLAGPGRREPDPLAGPGRREPDPPARDAEIFVGREKELRTLSDVAATARRGGATVLVTGEAGAGKSALLTRARRDLEADGWTVVVGRCPEFEGAPPAWAWVEALRMLARLLPPADPAPLRPLLADPAPPRPLPAEPGTRPPASALPASVPPASALPASVPPASALSASVPPASALSASVPPASALSASVPPASVLPASVLPASVPPATGAPSAAGGDDAAIGRFLLNQAVGGWIRAAAAANPLAIVIDDLHRADSETLALLETVTDLPGAPVLVMTAHRPTEVDDALGETLAEIARRTPYRLALTGLGPSDVATLVAAVCGGPVDRDTVARLVDRTGGNPFYVGESARLLASEGALVATSDVPQGVRDVLRRRLARLPRPAVAVLRLAAVVGREADVDVLVTAAETDEDGVLDGLEAGLIAGLLTEPAPGRVRFAHALVRDTLYTDLTKLRRSRMHTRVADAVQRLRPDDLTALAHHHALAGTTATASLAVEYGVRAADLARQRYAHDTEAELLEQAIGAFVRVPVPADDRDERLIELFGRLLRAQVRAGTLPAARRTRQRALDVAEQAGRTDLTAAAFVAWTEPTPWSTRLYGSVDHGTVAVLERLLDRDDLDPETRCRLLNVFAAELDGEDDPRVAVAAEEALTIARRVGDPRLLAATLVVAAKFVPWELFQERRAKLTVELRTLAQTHEMPAYRWACEHIDGMIAGGRGDAAGVRRHAEAALRIARRYGMAQPEVVHRATLAMLDHAQGRFDEAEARYDDVRDRMSRYGSLHSWRLHAFAICTIRFSQGRHAELEPLVRALYDVVGPIAGDALTIVLARQGRLDEARKIRRAVRVRPDAFHGILATLRAETAVLLGQHGAAPELIRRLLPLRDQVAGAASNSVVLRPVAHALGDLYRLVGDDRAAEREFAHAVQVARGWDSAHWMAAARSAMSATAAQPAVRE